MFVFSWVKMGEKRNKKKFNNLMFISWSYDYKYESEKSLKLLNNSSRRSWYRSISVVLTGVQMSLSPSQTWTSQWSHTVETFSSRWKRNELNLNMERLSLAFSKIVTVLSEEQLMADKNCFNPTSVKCDQPIMKTSINLPSLEVKGVTLTGDLLLIPLVWMICDNVRTDSAEYRNRCSRF